MRRTSVVTAILVLVLAISGSWYTAQAQGSSELAGAWLVTSRTSPDGEVNSSPQRGLYVFTESGHYSIMFVNGDEPRPQFSDEGTFGTPTDAEKLVAYDNFIANSGRYSVDADEISYEAYMAKNEKALAIENYEKSLELNPANQNAKERLQALRSQGEH